MRTKLSVHRWLLTCLVLLGLTTGLPVLAQVKVLFDLPEQPLADTIRAIGQKTGTNILFDPALTNGKAAQPVKGQFTAEEALARALSSSDLAVQKVQDGTISITARAKQADIRSELSPPEVLPKPVRGEGIVVTAQKRSERLQDVPISISVLRGADLDSSTDLGVAEALNRVPGVISGITTAGARSNIISAVVVRGVAPVAGAGGGGGVTGYYLDSIPFGFIRRSDAPDSSAYDLERVEVLRGPQGTLYGVNALNGVVRVLTRDANPDRFEIKTRGSASTTEDGSESYRGDLAVNVPIVDGKLAARAVIGYQSVGGWIDKPIAKDSNDAQIGNFRFKLNARPTDRLSLGLSTWFSRSDYGGPPVSADGRQSLSLFDEPSSVDYDAYGLRVGYDFDAFAFTSTTSYIDFKATSAVDFAPLSGPNVFLNSVNASRVFSQEAYLNSDDGPWRWTLGGIYRDASEQLFQTRTDPRTGALNSGYRAPTDQRTYSKSFAVFGELTRAFLDGKLEVTGGVRYFEDKTADREESFMGAVGGVPATGLATADNKFDNFSPRLVFTWHPSNQATVYASYAEGFRSGLSQLPGVRRAAPAFGPAQPDSLRSYELGAKGSLWNRRIHFDAAVFHIDWQDVQQSLVVLVAPGVPNNALINAGSASGSGFEFDVAAEPIDGLTLRLTYGRNDLQVDSDVLSNNVVFYPRGSRLTLSPKYSAGASADYVFPLGGSGYKGRISASANYLPRMISGRTATAVFHSDPITTSRASFAVESRGRWTASLFVDNLANEDGIAARDPFTPQWHTRLRPRTVGVQFEYRN